MQRSLISAALLLALSACASGPKFASNEELGAKSVTAFAETPAVATAEDAADDPAIWVNPDDASKSLILGTNKKAGLHVYDLQGQSKQFLPVGDVNNVDVRTVTTSRGPRHIAAATNRTDNSVALFEINTTNGELTSLGALPISQGEVYGYCLGLSASGSLMSYVTTKAGQVIVHRIQPGDMRGEYVSTWKFDGQLEGCASDDENGVVFIGEEENGVYSVKHADGMEIERTIVDTVANDRGLVVDVEGVDIWKGADNGGYLVVSSQGANRFVVYDRKAPYEWRGVFHIVDNTANGIDGVDTTDGLSVSSAALGDGLPQGLLVVQDNTNTNPDANQNFKLVDWRSIATALSLDGAE
tara:strand:+ start:352 stop:1416 length:1065 start_codon:yes stop_codon:yes gene_type:complete